MLPWERSFTIKLLKTLTLHSHSGVSLDISIEIINEYYRLMKVDINGDRGIRAADLTSEEVQSMRKFLNPSNNGENVMASELDIPSAICLTWIRDNVMPRCKKAGLLHMRRSFFMSLAKESRSFFMSLAKESTSM